MSTLYTGTPAHGPARHAAGGALAALVVVFCSVPLGAQEVGEVWEASGYGALTRNGSTVCTRADCVGQAVRLGDALETNSDAALRIKLDGDGLLVLGSHSQVVLEAPRAGAAPSEPTAAVARANLRHGVVRMVHDPPSLGTRVVEISTPNALVSPSGTLLQVRFDRVGRGRTDRTRVSVLDGRASVTGRGQGSVDLVQGTSTVVDGDMPPSPPAGFQLSEVPADLLGGGDSAGSRFIDSPLLDDKDLRGLGLFPP